MLPKLFIQSTANLDHVAQGLSKLSFEYLPGWRLHGLSGLLLKCLTHSYGEKDFSNTQLEFPCNH